MDGKTFPLYRDFDVGDLEASPQITSPILHDSLPVLYLDTNSPPEVRITIIIKPDRVEINMNGSL